MYENELIGVKRKLLWLKYRNGNMKMEIYFVLLCWSLISAVFCFIQGTSKFKKKIYLFINFVPLILVSGLRSSSVGTDTGLYNQLFYDLSSSKINFELYNAYGVEIGYSLLNQFVALFSDSSQLLIFVVAAITLVGFACFIHRDSLNVWISMFLFIGLAFFCETLNSVRQCFASMIICYSYVFLKKNNKKKYCIFVFIAMCIHASAIVFLPFLFLAPINRKKFNVFIFVLFCTSGLIYFLGLDILVQFNFSEKYIGYLASQYALPKESGMGIFRVLIFFSLTLVCFIYGKFERFNNDEKIDVYFWNIFLICACLVTLAQYQIVIFGRLIFYFAIYSCVIIPLILNKMGMEKYICYLVIIISTFFYFYRMLEGNPDFEYFLFFNI